MSNLKVTTYTRTRQKDTGLLISIQIIIPMKKAIVFIMILFPGILNLSKAQDFLKFKNSITENSLKKHVEILCNKDIGGRKFATQGERNAANYIRKQFINSGLTGSAEGLDNYFQNYSLIYDTLISFNIENQNKRLSNLTDFFTMEFCFLKDTLNMDVIYAGFGLDREDYSDYKNIDVKNKWVVVELNSPIDSTGKLIDFFDFNKSGDPREINHKKEIALKKGALGVIFKINTQKYPEFLSHCVSDWIKYRSKDIALLNRLYSTYPGILAKQSAIDSLMGVNTEEFNERINFQLKKHISTAGEKQTKISFKINKQQRCFKSQNVIGILKGKKEIVGAIISAHYDAVKDNDTLFYPGANDNASGTSAVIQLSNVFSKIVKSGYVPEKTLVFVAFSGEEEGLVGSEYFVNHNSFLIDSNSLDINLDCIGILESDNQYKDNFSYIYVPEREISSIKNIYNKLVSNQKQPFNIVFDPNFVCSDNASFVFEGIHAINLLTGWGGMHTTHDIPEALNYNNMESVTRFAYDIIQTKVQFSKANAKK
jgi:hypothetical protein